ncbi:MAG TPA: hypothetical protein PLR74_11690 [Agriterribacter sp.]|nr:hypothetical protein [Agriterribacter sp.]
MKMLCTLILIALFAAGCRQLLNREKVKDFAAGTFVSSWQTEYSQSRDTIQIEPSASEGSEVFLIVRRTLTEYAGNEKKRSPSYKIAKWTGVYMSESKTITIRNNGRILSFNPSEGSMTMGVTVYKKL